MITDLSHRCDRCGASACYQVILPTGGDLLFCRHHVRQHAKALLAHYSILPFAMKGHTQ